MRRFILISIVFVAFAGIMPLATLTASSRYADDATVECALPAPTNFIVNPASSSSMQLSWDASTNGSSGSTTYRIEVYDQNLNMSLPTMYTSDLSYLYEGLEEGHCYLFSVSATACGGESGGSSAGGMTPAGGSLYTDPDIYGPPVQSPECLTFIIVVDDVAQLNGQVNLPNEYFNVSTQTIVLPYGEENQRGLFKKILVKPSPTSEISATFFCYANAKREPTTKYGANSQGIERDPDYSTSLIETETVIYNYAENGVFFRMTRGSSDDNSTEITITFPAGQTGYIKIWNELLNSGPSTGGGKVEDHGRVANGNKNLTKSEHSTKNDGVENKALQTSALTPLWVFPNPASDYLQVQYQLLEASPVTITLYNTLGQAVAEPFNPNETQASGAYQVRLDIADIQPGIYWLVIQTNEGRQSKRLIKQ
jgi:hypothetical protein